MSKTRTDLLNLLKKDSLYTLMSYLIITIIFKIGFYNEPLFSLARIVFSFYWLFIIPGIAITYVLPNEMRFTERFFIGSGISAAIIGLLSYYAGLLGLHIQYHGVLLPLIILSFAIIMILKKNR